MKQKNFFSFLLEDRDFLIVSVLASFRVLFRRAFSFSLLAKVLFRFEDSVSELVVSDGNGTEGPYLQYACVRD